MNLKNIKRNLISSGLLCVLCIVLAFVCLWLHILELAAALGCFTLIELLIFGIWYKRYRKEKAHESASRFGHKQ